MKARTKRSVAVVAGLLTVCGVSALVLNAFQSNLVFFFSPTQVLDKVAPHDRSFRVGGLVQQGSLQRTGGLTVHFLITDTDKAVPVVYTGLLPDLFREGKGVVAQGKLGSNGVFKAEQVLAKHDENYMPPEAAAALVSARQTASSSPPDGPMGSAAPRSLAPGKSP